MRMIIATLLSLLSLGSTAAQPNASPGAQASADLRAMVLNLSPAELGVTEQSVGPVWGLVMETGMEGGYYTLVALADGSTSLYFSNGGGIIGGGEHASVRKASGELLATAKRHVGSATPASATPPPADGQTTFYFLTFDGIRAYTAPEVELGEERDRLAPLFHSAHSVIMELRLATSAEPIPVSEAEALFEHYQSLGRAFDPAAAGLYCDTALIRNVRTYPNGEQRALEMPAPQYKGLLRTVMPAAKARGDTNSYSQVGFANEGGNVRITALRYSDLKQYQSPISILVGKCEGGELGILEELTESRPGPAPAGAPAARSHGFNNELSLGGIALGDSESAVLAKMGHMRRSEHPDHYLTVRLEADGIVVLVDPQEGVGEIIGSHARHCTPSGICPGQAFSRVPASIGRPAITKLGDARYVAQYATQSDCWLELLVYSEVIEMVRLACPA